MASVLYVDDDSITRFLVRKSLELKGYAVHEAGDGKEALELLGTNPDINYVLLDLNMPVMNGFEFLKKVELNDALGTIKIIVTSGIPQSHFTAQANKEVISQNQIIGYLEKPLFIPDLVRILSTN
jgi:CheY-like chemotaxis protein